MEQIGADDKELGEWFDRIWLKYPNDLCHKKKGARKPAQDAARKIHKAGGMPELERIERNLDALVRYDRRDHGKGEKVDRWPHLSTWLNQGYYDREIEAQPNTPRPRKNCGCGEPSTVGNKCPRCYVRALGDKGQQPLSILSARLKQIGLARLDGESDSAWGRRCREYAMRHFKSMTRLVAERPVERVPGEDDEAA